MPNFIAKNLKNIELPASFDGVEFVWEAINGDEKLVYTKALGYEFCLVVKGRANNYVIKYIFTYYFILLCYDVHLIC